MTERGLLDRLGSLLRIIKKQDFRDPQNEDVIKKVHLKTTLELMKRGKGEEIVELQYKVSSEPCEKPTFVPTVVNTLYATDSILVGDENNPFSIMRDLIGREYVKFVGNQILIKEYLKPKNDQDQDLFRLAKKHVGFSGVEGVVTKTIYRRQAERLLFTSHRENGEESSSKVTQRQPAKVA